jgi:hypothetical protein
MGAASAGDFRPPLCPRCGLVRPPDAAPCSRCGLAGDACRWEGRRSASGAPEWHTRNETLGVFATAYPRTDGSWVGHGEEHVPVALPRGGPWCAVSDEDFARWLVTKRPLHAHEVRAARATLLAMRLASVGAIELVRIRIHGWSGSVVPYSEPMTKAMPVPGVAETHWVSGALRSLRERCRIEARPWAFTTPWLESLSRSPLPEPPRDEVEGIPEAANPPVDDPDALLLARSVFTALAVYLDP